MNTEQPSFKPLSLGAILLLALLIGLAIFIAWGIYKAAFPPRAPLQGQMEARTISIASKTPGRVGKILVKEGEMVEKGQLVAEIALPGLEARLAQAQSQERASKAKQSMVEEGPREQERDALRAEWEGAAEKAALDEKTCQRLAALFKDGLISAEHYDQARAAMQASCQAAAAAKEQYEMARIGSRVQ